MEKTFYCKIHTGSMESINEWNDVEESLRHTNLSEQEKSAILFPSVCTKQCFDCLAEVGETRMKTQKLITKQLNIKK